jgi:HPt (histidine-containing phosphotransfer) domain-containing protein
MSARAFASRPSFDRAPASLACDAPLVDEKTVAALLQLGGVEFLSSLLDQFAIECALTPPALCAALRADDWESFHALLHGLGSAAGNIGARRVFLRCWDWRSAGPSLLATEGDAFLAALAEDLARSLVALRRFAP